MRPRKVLPARAVQPHGSQPRRTPMRQRTLIPQPPLGNVHPNGATTRSVWLPIFIGVSNFSFQYNCWESCEEFSWEDRFQRVN